MADKFSLAQNFYTLASRYLKLNLNAGFSNVKNSKSRVNKVIFNSDSSKEYIPPSYIRGKRKGLKGKRIKHHRRDYVFQNGRIVIKSAGEGDDVKGNGFSTNHIGTHHVRTGVRDQSYFKPPNPSTDFYHLNSNLLDDKIPGFEDYLVVNGCFHTNKHSLQLQFDRLNHDGSQLPEKKAFKEFEKVVKSILKKLRIKTISPPTIEDLIDVSFNYKTKPGFRYEEYFGFRSKADARDIALEVAERRWEKIEEFASNNKLIERGKIYPGFYTIGARNKREIEPVNDELADSRAIHMPEYHTEIHAGAFSDLVSRQIMDRQNGPIYIGNSIVSFKRFEKDLGKNYMAIEGDWKKFDSSITNVILLISLSIMRCYFPKGFDIDSHFLAICDNLILKDYVLPGGKVYRVLQGLPSGSKLTSILGSFINFVCLMWSCSKIKHSELSFAIGGDDFVVFFRNVIEDFDAFKNYFEQSSKLIGFEIKIFEFKNYSSGAFEDFPVFYKYTVFNGVPVVPADCLLTRMLCPMNKRYKTSRELLKLLNDLIPSLGYPLSHCIPFYEFYRMVFYNVFKREVSVSYVYKKHLDVYNRVVYRKTAFYFDNVSDFDIILPETKQFSLKYINTVFPSRIKSKLSKKFIFKDSI